MKKTSRPSKSSVTVKIRALKPKDREAVQNLWQDQFDHHYRLDAKRYDHMSPSIREAFVRYLDDRLAAADEHFFVAEEAGALVGFASYRIYSENLFAELDLKWGEVTAIHVHSDWRGKGIGKLLMSHLEQTIAKHNPRGIRIVCDAANIDTRAFYASLGYRDARIVMYKPIAE